MGVKALETLTALTWVDAYQGRPAWYVFEDMRFRERVMAATANAAMVRDALIAEKARKAETAR
jgi:hypothetical protein